MIESRGESYAVRSHRIVMTPLPPESALRVTLGGVPVDLAERATVDSLISARLGVGKSVTADAPPLLVASANLHHLGEFRPDGPLGGFYDRTTNIWLVLLDGAPLANRAAGLTGRPWPLLSGSDLLPDLLADAAKVGTRVGFLGGAPELAEPLRAVCTSRWPALMHAGHWTPPRAALQDPVRLVELAAAIRGAGIELLIVGLGKPQQESWLDTWAVDAGIRVGLAFGASVEFLTGAQTRAPGWVRRARAEWLWRLGSDPKRLARRYLIEGPGEYRRLRRDSCL